MAQLMQVKAPAYVPAGQSVQIESPLPEDCPAPQSTHVAALEAPAAAECLPAAQLMQVKAPAYVPAGQSVQIESPLPEDCPAPQSTQLEAPAAVEYLPAAHLTQVAADDCPCCVE